MQAVIIAGGWGTRLKTMILAAAKSWRSKGDKL